jgi:hypothetical protein
MFNSFVDGTYAFIPAEPPKKRLSHSAGDDETRRRRSRTDQSLTRKQIVTNALLELERRMFGFLQKRPHLYQQIFESVVYQRFRTVLTTLQSIAVQDPSGDLEFFTYLKNDVQAALHELSSTVNGQEVAEVKSHLLESLRIANVSNDFISFLKEGHTSQGISKHDVEEDVSASVAAIVQTVAGVADAIEAIPDTVAETVVDAAKVAVETVARAVDGRSRRNYSINTWYKVRLSDFAKNLPKKEVKAALRKLAKGPQRWKLLDFGVSTMTFQVKTNDISVNSNHVVLEPLLVEEPSELQHNMLIEVTWQNWPEPGQDHTGVYRYVVLEDGANIIPADKLESELTNADFWEFDPQIDEWRFPEYPVLQVDDVVDVQFTYDYRRNVEDQYKARGTQRVIITEPKDSDENTHSFRAECVFPKRVIEDSDSSTVKKSKQTDNQVIVDVWYRQLKFVDEDSVPESSGVETEDLTDPEDDDRTHDNDDTVEYRGKKYAVTSWDRTDDDEIEYELTPKGALAPDDVIRVSQVELDDSWSPEISQGEFVLFDGRAMLVAGHDYVQSKYILKDAPQDGPESKDSGSRIMASEDEVFPYEDLPNHVGLTVVFNWEICNIVSVDNIERVYILDNGCEGNVPCTVSQSDLERWSLKVQDQSCWYTEDVVERTRMRGPKNNKKSVKVKYYQLVAKNQQKQEVTESDFENHFKTQDDVDAFLKSQSDSIDDDDADGTEIVTFHTGDSVEIYNVDGKHRSGTIVRYVPGKIPEDDSYVILVDGQEKEINVAGFGRYEEDSNGSSEESFDDPMDETDSSDSSETDEEEDEEESFFNPGEDVVWYNGQLYHIDSAASRTYTLVDDNGAQIENVPGEELTRYTNDYEEGAPVYDANFDQKEIDIVYGDGTYKLLGVDEHVHESDLHAYRTPLTGLVKVIDSDEIYEVVSGFDKGNYLLKNAAIEDGVPQIVYYDLVYAFDGPKFDNDQVVRYDQDMYGKVVSFDNVTATYTLKGAGRRRFRESELTRAEDMKLKGESVQIWDEQGEQKVLKIKKVDEIERTYTLSDNSIVNEDDVEEPPLEDE